MNIKEFYDLGFVIDFEDAKTSVRRRVLEGDPLYSKIFAFAKEHTYKETDDYCFNELHCFLSGIGSSGDQITSIRAYFDDNKAEQVILKFGEVLLDVDFDKETGFVYRVYDRFPYFKEWVNCASYGVYEYVSPKDDRLAQQLLFQILDKRYKDAQAVRNHYNQEIKNLKQAYRRRLDKSKAGLQDLAKVATKEVNQNG